MAGNADIRWYRDHVEVVVEDATEEVIKKLAMRITERAQLNIRSNDQIDTGFMVNSVYPIWRGGSDYHAARLEAEQHSTGKDGRHVDHSGDMAPEARLRSDAMGGVVVGANYAIYQEARNAFLYPAGEAAAREFGGEATQIYRQAMPDEGSKI